MIQRHALYRAFFDIVFRRMDPEDAHRRAFRLIEGAGRVPVLRRIVQGAVAPYLGRGAQGPGSVRVLGRSFPARFGLAAGFDKDARAVRGLSMLGFGFVEIGTVTARPQPGNDKPRMWREVHLEAVRNRMGFNNEGADAVAERLAALRGDRAGRAIVVGVNIGKNKTTPAERAADDYVYAARALARFADYLVVNVSSPNTPGLRDLQAVASLRPILVAVRAAADAASPDRHVPLLVKIAPDLSGGDIDDVADLVRELGLDGVVAVNTTVEHDLGPGGLSGAPLTERGVRVVRRLRGRLGDGPAIIGAGGIADAADARRYLEAGADLIQGYTGFLYNGPFWAAGINRALARDARRRAR